MEATKTKPFLLLNVWSRNTPKTSYFAWGI